MEVKLSRISGDFHMKVENESGNSIEMDASPAIGGTNLGMRPMEVVLAALSGCSSIDVIEFLKKQRQTLEHIEVKVTAEREKDKVPALFTDIHVHYKLWGKLDDKKVQRAVNLSMEKYCSVSKILEATAKITHSYEVINEA